MLLVDSCVFIDAFDPESPNHKPALRLLERLSAQKLLITMPAHGWFEIQCTLQRLREEGRFMGPVIDGKMDYSVELIHIDDKFIRKYAMAEIPYIKGGDHIFVAIAQANRCSLITSDQKMISVSKDCDISVFTPDEYIKKLDGGA